jgi:preprotein translocase subunit SecD
LTASRLHVDPSTGSVDGYTSNSKVPADPQFATYPSSSTEAQATAALVLLPGTPSAGGSDRYVVGPAEVTASSVESAQSAFIDGQWIVDLTLTATGSKQWDHLSEAQFHALVAVVVDGTVVSIPIIQPTQSTFTSFNGSVQLAGGFTEHEAKVLAVSLSRGTSG